MITHTANTDTLHSITDYLRENTAFIILALLMFCFRSAVVDWSHVPTGSMLPTIVQGDRISIDKAAYDIRIPFTHISVKKIAEPERGDIVIFDSKVSNKRLVKRIMGLPGDQLEMRSNVLFINGEALDYEEAQHSAVPLGYVEQVEHGAVADHRVRLSQRGSSLDDFAPLEVPEEHYFMLGDNRDDSADSRVIGFVPRAEIVGRAEHVVVSINYDNYYLPRSDRFFDRL